MCVKPYLMDGKGVNLTRTIQRMVKVFRNVVLIIDELAVFLNDPKVRREIQRYLF